MQHSADGRVAKAQLDFVADVICGSRFSAPFWAFIVAILCWDRLHLMGALSFGQCLLFPLTVAAVILAANVLVSRYRRETARDPRYERLETWFLRFTVLQAVVSAMWGLALWLLWQPRSEINHLYLLAAIIAIIARP
jgi:hypothetical protein